MARGKYISDFERDVMRIGVSRGFKAPAIARFLGRQKVAVYNHIRVMEDEGTLENVMLEPVADEIAQAIRDKEIAMGFDNGKT